MKNFQEFQDYLISRINSSYFWTIRKIKVLPIYISWTNIIFMLIFLAISIAGIFVYMRVFDSKRINTYEFIQIDEYEDFHLISPLTMIVEIKWVINSG